jgi:transcriptional regulator with XRE-family HTH domain
MGQGSNTRFATTLVKELERQGISMPELAQRTNLSYEHIRKLAKGLAYPSEPAVAAIAKALALDRADLLRMVVEDKMGRTFRFKFHALTEADEGLDPLLPIKRVWSQLTPEQREMVIGMVQGMADRNRHLRHAK